MKKVTATILFFMLVLSFAGCSNTSKPDEAWLPYGLQFGVDYAQVKEVFSNNGYTLPNLTAANANASFLTKSLHVKDGSFDWSFLHSDTLTSQASSGDVYKRFPYQLADPMIAFSFNQDKELYEMYCLFNNTCKYSDEIAEEIISYYDEVFGEKGCPDGFANTPHAEWKTEELFVELFVDDEVFAIIFHNYEYDLDR